MAAEIKLTKTDESPWGFRLTGGRDFGTPLTILKVGLNSIAERAGLRVGDILVKVNNESGPSLTHREAHDIIRQSGNSLTFSVLRGNLNLPEEVIGRLTPLPLQELISHTPEPGSHSQSHGLENSLHNSEQKGVVETQIEIIPIKDLEPEQLQELGLKPLPEDFLEKALRDPSPLPEVRPIQTSQTPDILETLDQLGLQDVVENIERQNEAQVHNQPEVPPTVPLENSSEVPSNQETSQPEQSQPVEEPQTLVEAPPPEYLVNKPPTEPDFVEIMTGKAEVIEGTHAIGVDFKKYEPQAEFLKKSQVFQTLQEEQRAPSPQKEKEKRWTTFLEKPDRPRPKPKPKTKEIKPQPKPESVQAEPESLPEPATEQSFGLYEIPSQEEFENLVKVPEPEPQPEGAEPTSQEINEEPTENGEQTEEVCLEEQKQQLVEEQQLLQQQLDSEKPILTVEEKSDIELQLEEIQKQLEAIQQLPFEIQQHLSLVQDQLTKIVQHRMQEQTEKILAAPRPSIADIPETEIPKQDETCEPEEPESEEPTETTAEKADEPAQQEPETCQDTQDEKKEFKLRAEEEDAVLPPPKKEKPKKKKPFLGLGPAPRPLILPGGRKWRTPKDAYNEEFIAETLSAQAEIITGTTLGVNFRKYEPKHPSLEHLRQSGVYKMVHDLEESDYRGLANRPEIVPAIQDFVQPQATPAAI